MRIFVDLRCLQTPPPRGGVAVFAEGMVRAMLAHGNLESGIRNQDIEWTLFANGLVNPRRHLPAFDAPNVRWMIGRTPNKLVSAASVFQIPDSRFQIPDTVFLPNLNFLPPLPKRTRLVVTVHDLSFEHFPEFFTWKQRAWHRFVRPRSILERADAIITVSETTKRDVVETYGIPEKKVHVVYPGLPFASFRPERAGSERSGEIPDRSPGDLSASLEMTKRYVLSIAELSPRKNLDGLIAAFEQTPTPNFQLPTPHLVLAGAHGSATHALQRQIARSPARDRIHLLGPVTEQEKRALLAHASCFVYPSIWEGFGFPPLEAMASGVPVVASTGGSLPEILGDAALLVDAFDPTAIAGAIARILTDDALRADLIVRGRTHAARYRWEDAARRTFAILTAH